jgi:hypothetical protein
MSRKTFFNNEWLDEKKFPEFRKWLQPVKNNKLQAYCVCCNKAINLSNMAKRALTSHYECVGHKRNLLKMSNTSRQSSLNFITNRESTESGACSELQTVSLTSSQSKISSSHFITKDEVAKAEVLWILYLIEHHLSYNSCKSLSSIFQKMFTDSTIAQKVTLSPSKIGYAVTFGLAPYFANSLLELIKQSAYYAACFDESLNSSVQRGQMDIWIRFWNMETSEV